MGAKTGILVFADQDVPKALRETAFSDREAVAELVRQVHPGYTVEYADERAFGNAVYPPHDTTYAAELNGTVVLCDVRFMIDRPSELSPHLLEMAAGRRVILHAMHSVVDWLAFAVWEGGTLVRSLSLSPDSGIMEDIGEPMAFERPYWAGKHPVTPVPGWPDQGPYPLPFHPLEMGEDALRELFGFILEGQPRPDDVDPYAVPLHGFRAFDPTGEEQAEREERMAELREQMGPPQTFRYVDGALVEVDLTSALEAAGIRMPLMGKESPPPSGELRVRLRCRGWPRWG